MMDCRSSIHSCSILHLFLILSISTIMFSDAADTLLPKHQLGDGHTLISANQTFELGFFSPGGSNNRYIGIWYHKPPTRTVVWVGNRDHPVWDASGSLMTDEGGNLIILDSIGSLIMVASSSGSANSTAATLTDSGNLVLKEWSNGIEGRILWQSFDHPTDTLIPGMMLGLYGRENRLLTSWRSSEDPVWGEFSSGIDPNGTKQFFIWKRGDVYWWSGEWNGKNFSSVPEMTPTYYYNFSYTPLWIGGYYSYSLNDSSILTRTVMDVTGQLKQLTWFEDSQEWVEYFVQPKKYACELSTDCGFNGLCDNSTSQACSCLRGFVPDSVSAWNSGDWSRGCVRQARLACGDGDGFYMMTGVKLPIMFLNVRDPNLGIGDCKAKCVGNCSCTAYASASVNGTGCLLWFGELLGLQVHYDGNKELYIRLVASELVSASDDGSNRQLWIIILVTVVVIMLLVGAFLYCLRRRELRRRAKQKMSQELRLLSADSTVVVDRDGERVPDCIFFSFSTIVAATNNFSASNKLGEGGFGPVYKGMLEGHELAVKRLSRSSGQGQVEFKNEITLIANLQHTNLVRLLGCCIQGEEKLLIYEYMPNKSLDSYIFDSTKGVELDWDKRFHIIVGIAQGLLYLHKYSRFRVIHRDLKASNILLDGEMNPKISDFGMARIFGRNELIANTNRVVGTYGYMSPEYAMEGLFSEKSDVFSYGVLLLEILSGKKNSCFRCHSHQVNLLGYAWELWKEEKLSELMDPLLGDMHPSKGISRCLHVALLCVQDSAADRPTMPEVVSMLNGNQTISLQSPKQPVFSIRRTTETDLPSSMTDVCSVNDITVSAMGGR